MPTFDITDRVIHELGLVAPTATAGVNVPASLRWDCSIGGLPFLYGMSKSYPMRRETAEFRRQRVDTERNPGEQSLDSGYWLRSQASWHYGSGLSSAEPLEVSEQEAQFRYATSGGVDVWTPGQASLLKTTSNVFSSTGTSQYLIGVDTGVLHADGTTVTYITNAGSSSSVTWGGSAQPVTSLTSDGANYYAANSVGIYKGTLPSSAGSKIWDTGSTTVARWIKSRLMAAVGPSLYELTTGGPTLPTALFTHSNSSWTWTDWAEGPAAIYVSGYSGDTSAIYKIAVDTTTTTITLDQPAVVADMPRSELVFSLYAYVGAYLVVGTSKGVRIASIASDGSLNLGPLVVQTSDGSFDAVADGSFVYVTVGTKGEVGNRTQRAGLYRIDLGTNLNNSALQFASAPDLVAADSIAGTCKNVTTAGGLVWFTVTGTGGGVYRQSATDYVPEGWLETGRIRLGTVENKAWRSIRLLQDPDSTGSIAAFGSVVDSAAPSTWTPILSLAAGEYDQTGSLTSAAPVGTPSLYVAFELIRTATTSTPVFIGYQVKAMPAPKRSQLVAPVLMCFDRETDRLGARYGVQGLAWERYSRLKELEQAAATVQWRDYTTGETAEAFIEQVSMTRTAPPSREESGAGGLVTVTLRLV